MSKTSRVLFLYIALLASQSIALETICVVRELDEVQVPAKQDGVIEQLNVRRGMRIAESDPIATLESRAKQLRLAVTKSELQQAIVKSKNDGEVLSSRAAVSRAVTEQKLIQELGSGAVFLEKFRMKNSLDRAQAELRSAESVLRQNGLQVQVKQGEVALLENDLLETEVRSPVHGVVRELLKHQGEWVNKGEAIVSVTRMDMLLAEGFVDSKKTSVNSVIGAAATVTFRIGGKETFKMEGLIVERASPKLELDGNFPVWVEFKNRMVTRPNGQSSWLIRPGMRATMSIDVQTSPIPLATNTN